MRIALYVVLYLKMCNSFVHDLCVVGAGGGLGRELVYQAINDRNNSVLALTTSYKIYKPYRGNTYNDIKEMSEFHSSLLTVDNYWKKMDYSYKSLVICVGGLPFEVDYSDTLTLKCLENLPNMCKDVSIVSAYSVEDNSLEKFSLPFQIMSNFYLKDVYRSKRNQETILKEYSKTKIRKKCYKPRALSYGNTFLPSTSRMDLAREILDAI
tara:strand:- start:243 stop:872 length:630 start_codon:yes stop_codon:yes gene_type:complete